MLIQYFVQTYRQFETVKYTVISATSSILKNQESRRHLSRLESLGGLGSLVKDISSLEEKSERADGLDNVGGLMFSLLFCTLFLCGRKV